MFLSVTTGRNMIFVFGSNLAGIHGAGAADTALHLHGAEWGVGAGLVGKSYAIPTKDQHIKTLPLSTVESYIRQFLAVAEMISSYEVGWPPEFERTEFNITRIGCGLAGFKDFEIAPLFMDAPANCVFDSVWTPWLRPRQRYWGTF